MNHQRLYRLYREEHLAVRRLRRRRLIRPSAPMAQVERAKSPGQVTTTVRRLIPFFLPPDPVEPSEAGVSYDPITLISPMKSHW
jgi:hypothetical protein